MKIAISSIGPSVDDEVDSRFGRCQHFIIVDIDTDTVEVLNNSNIAAAGGAGISAAQQIAKQDIEAILTGNCGPNAYKVFEAAGIKVITGVSGKVKDAMKKYQLGAYSESKFANVDNHHGLAGS